MSLTIKSTCTFTDIEYKNYFLWLKFVSVKTKIESAATHKFQGGGTKDNIILNPEKGTSRIDHGQGHFCKGSSPPAPFVANFVIAYYLFIITKLDPCSRDSLVSTQGIDFP